MSLKDSSLNVATPVPQLMRQNKWTYGLFGCLNDMGVCFQGCCCTHCLIAKTSAQLDNNPEPCLCCYPGDNFKIRAQAEAQFAIEPEGCATACFKVACCPTCSAIQVAREVNARRQLQQMHAPQQVIMGTAVMQQPVVQLQYA